MSEVISRDAELEKRIILAADFDADFNNLRHMFVDLGNRVHSIKLGQGFLLRENAYKTHMVLAKLGTDTALDAKYEEDPDQMGSVVSAAFKFGFKHVSVAPAAGVDALVRAAEATCPGRSIFAVLPSNDEKLADLSLENIVEANESLDDDHKIGEISCNVNDISRVKQMGGLTVMATGIRLYGDNSHDQPSVMTPAEALDAGADYLVVGRAIMGKANREEAFNMVVENMKTA